MTPGRQPEPTVYTQVTEITNLRDEDTLSDVYT